MKSPNIERISLKGNHFILINSIALEGDGCFLCKPTEEALLKMAGKICDISHLK